MIYISRGFFKWLLGVLQKYNKCQSTHGTLEKLYNMHFIRYTLNIIEWFGVIVRFQKHVNSFSRLYVTSIPVSPHPLSDVMMQGPDTQIGCRPPQVLPQESALREAKLVSELLRNSIKKTCSCSSWELSYAGLKNIACLTILIRWQHPKGPTKTNLLKIPCAFQGFAAPHEILVDEPIPNTAKRV